MNNTLFWTTVQRFIIKYRILLLILLIGAGAWSTLGIFKLNITVDIEDFFLEDDPILAHQDTFDTLFQTKEFIGVLVESDNVFSRETLTLIKKTSTELETQVPFSEEAITITGFSSPLSPQVRLTFENDILVSSDEEIDNYKELYAQDNTLKGVFFSEDHREAWILLPLQSYESLDDWKGEDTPFFTIGKETYDTIQSIQASLQASNQENNTTLTATGFSVYAYRKKTEMLNDLIIILIIGAVVACLLSTIIFRSIKEVCATLLLICLSVVYVLGIQGWLGISIDSAFISVPILLSAGVGIGYAVHIITFFKHEFTPNTHRTEAVISAVSKCALPIFFTAFTTTVGLFSFMFVNIKPIRWVGYTSALCIIAVFLLSVILFPIIISFGKHYATRKNKPSTQQIHPIFNMLTRWIEQRGLTIIIIFCILTGLGIYGILQVQVDLDAKKMTGTKLTHMKDIIRIGDSQIGSNEILDLVISTDNQSMLTLATQEKITELEKRIATLELVKQTDSLAKNIAYINYSNHGKQSEYNTLPTNPSDFSTLLILIDTQSPDLITTWSNPDNTAMRISIKLSDFSSKKIKSHIDNISRFIEETFPEDTHYFFSGSTFQMSVMNQYITKGLIQSLFIALLTITVIMIIIFRSITLGLIAMIPNIFPVIVAGGIMGLLNIPLEFVTMTVAPLILGLSVDDTIHLIWHLKEDLTQHRNFRQGLQQTFSVVGKAITQTTCILCITFLVFTFSQVNNIVYMGIIICSGLLAAYLSDILVTPILVNKITNKNNRT